MNPILEAALEYLNKYQFSIIPLNPSCDEKKEKRPFIEWKEFQDRLPTEEEVRNWWNMWPDAMIGIPTGHLSNILALDADSDAAKEKLELELPDSFLCPVVSTPRPGHHYWMKYSNGIRNSNNGLIHWRGEGGFIVAPPSRKEDGKEYTWIVNIKDCPVADPPCSIINLINNACSLYKGSAKKEENTQNLSTTVYNIFDKGNRDETIFHVAHSMLKGGSKEEVVWEVTKIIANNCNPPFPESEAKIKFDSAKTRILKKERNLAEEVKEWILSTSGNFLSTNIENSLHLSTREEKKNLSIILKRNRIQGLIEKVGNINGCFRRIETEVEELDILADDPENANIVLPFKLGELCTVPQGGIIIIAGVKSSGKTAFMFNMIAENMGRFGRKKEDIIYMTSELSRKEVGNKAKAFRIPDKTYWARNFRPIRRTENWSDSVTDEDKLFFVDYIDIVKDFFEVGVPIKAISDKLRKGVAIIGLQKPAGRDTGLGGERTLDKARLYISMETDRMKIVDAKYPIGESCRGLTRKYIIRDKGSFFDFQTDWITQDESEKVWKK